MDEYSRILDDIRSLKIQGAHAVARAALRALVVKAESVHAQTPEELYSALLVASDDISSVRPTEPLLRNTLRHILTAYVMAMQASPAKDVPSLLRVLREKEQRYFDDMERNREKIVEYGAHVIPRNAHVLTHCHSSTVMRVLIRAHELKKNIRVTCTETRPKQQGFTSARELARAGIPTRLIIDSAVKSFFSEFDFVLIGADAITATGDLINKIGTYGIASFAFDADVPVYVATELAKFDPLTSVGIDEPIEERDPSEIVGDVSSFAGVEIRNPAFDKTPAKFITGYITERGILSPHVIPLTFQQLLGDFSRLPSSHTTRLKKVK